MTASTPEPRVGVIGLGNMGGRMTRRLVDAGTAVLGYDLDPEAAGRAGASRAGSVAEVATASDVVLLSLPDGHVVDAVCRGPEGLLQHCRPGQIVVDLSTAAPAGTVRIAEAFDAHGVQFLDAGISGGAAAAERGRLTLMVGGSAEALAALGDLFSPIATTVVHMGANGAGHSTKVLNNFLNAIALSATAEVMVAAKKAGLDLARVLEVFNAGSAINFATLNRFPLIITGDYLEGGLTGALMIKDILLYLEHIAELGVPALNAAGPLAAFGAAANLGYGDLISNRVVDAIGDLAGGVRLHEPWPR